MDEFLEDTQDCRVSFSSFLTRTVGSGEPVVRWKRSSKTYRKTHFGPSTKSPRRDRSYRFFSVCDVHRGATCTGGDVHLWATYLSPTAL